MLGVMADNSTQLQHFGPLIDINSSFEEIFTSIQAAQPVSTISSLALSCNFNVNPLVVSRHLIDLCLTLKYLTRLNMDQCTYCGHSCIQLLEIIQHLSMLESLEFEHVTIDNYNTAGDLFYAKLSSIHTSTLESLRFADCLFLSKGPVLRFNRLLAFILQSCPNLKKFDLSTRCTTSSIIILDFRRNIDLHYTKISMHLCQYFAFHHELGKYWRSVNEKITEEYIILEQEEEFQYSAHLAWDTTKSIKLEFALFNSPPRHL